MQMSEPADEVLSAIRPSLPLRVRLLGDARLKKIVSITLKEWPVEQVYAAGDDVHKDAVWQSLEEQVKESYAAAESKDGRYGFVFLSLILAAAISTVVQQIILWWWNKPKNRELMARWQSQK